ncbi:MAG: hypothetical protein O3B24_02850 [Verrucomicrobia bacterium]|nr:hypothetical protein [Verrucomicrobiota bacterium]
MRKHIGWTERDADRQKREIRVRITSDRVHWDQKIANAEHWQRDVTPTAADWEILMEKMENWYRRRAASYDALLTVRRAYATRSTRPSLPPSTADDALTANP